MIYFFSGTPGSGKSLDMARCILNDLRFNRPVICNFAFYPPVKLQNKEYVILENSDLNPNFLMDYSKKYFENHKFKEGAICLYIDECQLLFNARTWNIRGRESWNKFFTNHRHLGYDIVLSAQFDRMIDRQIRSLFEVEVIHRKVNSMGLKGLFFRVLFASPTLFLKIHYYYPIHEKLRVEFFRYSKKYSRLYNSYDLSFISSPDAVQVATEKEVTEPRQEDKIIDEFTRFLLEREFEESS